MTDPKIRKFDEVLGGMNTSPERIVEHVKANIRQLVPQLRPWPPRDVGAVIAAGGPSLATGWDELKVQIEAGAKLCTVNNTHGYCVERGLIPDIHVQLDARPFNTRFVQPPQEKTLYLMASQCHPSAFESLKGHRVAIFHCNTDSGEKEVLDDYYFKSWWCSEGGCTVTLRALSVLHTLGFRRFDIYGFDSCLMDGAHHAYSQPENDREPTEKVMVGEREFVCHGWMADQAVHFMKYMKARAGQFENIRVHGDGLIAALMQAGHDKQLERENGTEDRRDADAA